MNKVPASRPRLLIVDDDADMREQMRWALLGEYEIVEAGDRDTAVELVRRESPDLVTLDLGLPPHQDGVSEGLQALEQIVAVQPHAKIVVITGNSDHAHALQAVRSGAYDFMQKPVALDTLQVVLARAAYLVGLERENRMLAATAATTTPEIIGTSPAMQKVLDTIRRVAGAEIPVLILGESGTGKELVARAIHRHSSRRAGPFIAINCGAIPEALLESELFGHEKGSFTGAHAQRKGRVETAEGGTLFLDEVGELPLGLQVKLLRFLQERTIERIGGRGVIEVDARIVSATNRDLLQAQAEGRFREDLYYRLCTLTIPLPPLREREGDIPLLANQLLARYADECKRKIRGFSPGAITAMAQHSWPGNVRELENRIRRAVVMAQGGHITPEDLELSPSNDKSRPQTLKEARELVERDLIRRTLMRNHGNISKSAMDLGISRPTLHDLINKYEVTP
ncbi:MAG: PEP-CTERM-box response regulator transcription factor [Nitrospira sp.]|jgi:two-component system NtrC family response regulator|nr:PEP-CTERM-box response regulator transcription factor [Nitrospira sp.]